MIGALLLLLLSAIDANANLHLSSLTDDIASKTQTSSHKISIPCHNCTDDRRRDRAIDYIDLH